MRILLTAGFLCILHFCYGQEYLKLGDACYTKKDYTCAYDNYMKAYVFKMDAKRDLLYGRIGYCLHQMKKYEEARIWYWHSLSEKESSFAIWNLASACYSLKRYDSAALYYIKAFSLVTDTTDKRNISYWAAKSYYAQKNYTQARIQANESLKYDSTYALLLAADIAYELKENALAEKMYLKGLTTEKDSSTIVAINRRIGHIHYNAYRYAQSLPFYRNALRFDDKNALLMEYCGDVHRNLKQYDSVKYYYKKALDTKLAAVNDPDSSKIGSLCMLLIRNSLLAKDTLQTLTYFPVVIKYDPLNKDLETELENVLTLRKDLKSMEAIIPEYSSALVAKQKKYIASLWHELMGELYQVQKQPQKAMESYRTAMVVYPSSSSSVISYINMLITDKKYREALDIIEDKLKAGILSKPRLLNVKGKVMYFQKDTVNAAASFREALKSEYSFESNYYMGMMALQRKDTAGAYNYWGKISDYSSPSANVPKDALVTVFRFNGLWLLKKAMAATTTNSYYSNAADYLNKSLAWDSSHPSIKMLAGNANLQVAASYDASGTRLTAMQISKRNELFAKARYQLTLSIDAYRQKKDSLGFIYQSLAYIAAKAPGGVIKDAIPLYQKAMETNPKDSGIINDLAIAYYLDKDYTKAAEIFGKNISMLKNSTNKAEALYNRALSYYQTKQKELSLADVGQCLILSPQHAEAKKLKNELEKPGG